MKNRQERVLDYLKKYKKITPLEALRCCHTMRLSAVIYNLKKEGYKFVTKMVRVHTMLGWQYVAQYSLED